MAFLEALTGILITLGLFTTVVLSLYFYFRARHTERMAMIEKGYQAPEIKKANKSLKSLKYGILFIGVAFGLFFGYLLTEFTRVNPTTAYFCMIFLFGGAGLVLNFYLESRLTGSKD